MYAAVNLMVFEDVLMPCRFDLGMYLVWASMLINITLAIIQVVVFLVTGHY